MEIQFGHPSSEKLLDTVANLFKNKNVFATNTRHIVFVCGGNDRGRTKAARPRFIEYAKKHIPQIRIFLAEAATKDLLSHGKPRFLNVAEFENLIAEISDCVLIFPESPGSIAEVAYFAREEKICQRILVVSQDKYQSQDSFINLGIIALVDKFSAYKPAIQIDYKAPKFNHIKKRLDRYFPSVNRERIDYTDYKKLSTRNRFFLVYELIRIFGVINLNGIKTWLGRAYGIDINEEAFVDELSHFLSILYAAGYVLRRGTEKQYFVPKGDLPSFLEIEGINLNSVMLQTANYFKAHEKDVFALLQGVTR